MPTISGQVTEFEWSQSTPPRLRIYAKVPFLTGDGVPVLAGSPYGGKAYVDAACTLDGSGRVVVPDVVVPYTEDSIDKPDEAEYIAFLYSRGADQSSQYQEFSVFASGFRVPLGSDPITWEEIRLHNLGSLPALSPHDVEVTGDLDVGGDLNVGDDGNFDGTVTAAAFVGNGAGITGLTGATGGVSNTGSTTIGADTDDNGVGVVDLQTRNLTRARVNNDGTFELFKPARLMRYPTLSIPAGLKGHFAFDEDRNLPVFHDGAGWRYIHGRVMFDLRQDFGAVGDDTTDDTDAYNDALIEIAAAGGGALFIPMPPGGAYYVGGPLDPDTNSVIAIPQNPWTGSSIQSIPITLMGEVPPPWGDFQVLAGGVVIRSDTAGSGNFPAILSAKAWAAAVPGSQHLHWNYVHPHVENLIFRTEDNPTLGGVNFMKAHRASACRVLVDTGVTETTSPATSVAEPTNSVIGLAFPQTENNGMSTMQDVTVKGYRTGFYASDHFRALGFCMAERCYYGWQFEHMAGMGAGTLYSYRNLHTFNFTGVGNNIFHFILMEETDTTSGGWNERTVGTTNDWIDGGNTTKGVLYYILESPGGLQYYPPTYTGMSRVRKVAMHQPNATARMQTTGRVTVPNNTVTYINWNKEITGGAQITHSESTNPDQITINLTGMYRIRASALFVATGTTADTNAGTFRQLGIVVDGVNYSPPDTRVPVNGAFTSVSAELEIFIAKGSVVRVYANQDSGASMELLGGYTNSIFYTPILNIVLVGG